jgi:predicted DsbA family dithiol-disulfide isomerase
VSTRLDIISDPVCPWCYLGAANLMSALATRPEHPFEIRWRPFQLNPDMPPEGMDRKAYVTAKFGGEGQIDAMNARLEAMGAEAGIAFRFERIARSPNTLDAHRLIRWAGAEGVQTRAAMALFRRYFEAGEDISDAGVLEAAAGEAGMDGAVVARLLEGDADRAEVRAEVEEFRAMGVTGVPTFVIGGRHVVSGAQPIDLWTRVTSEIEAAAARP